MKRPQTMGKNMSLSSVVTGPSGHTTSTQTFVPTTYSQFKEASTTVFTNAVVTVQYGGTFSSFPTYSYEIGTGVSWRLTSLSSGVLFPLLLPRCLTTITAIPNSHVMVIATKARQFISMIDMCWH